MIRLSRAAAEALERGRLRGPLSRVAAQIWQHYADPVRPLALPARTRVIGVGGATLGGSGKTPFVLELARQLGDVAVVASGYRSKLHAPRRITPDDPATLVGDEAALLARSLCAARVPVVGGADRERALALAATLASTVIVDALLQCRPERLAVSFLVVDASEPWGSGRCPPSGDLRAAPQRLLEATDNVVRVERAGAPTAARFAFNRPLLVARSELHGATTNHGRVALDELSNSRLGLVLAVARPQRIIDHLAAHGIVPAAVELFGDHRAPLPRRAKSRVDAWLTTAKCATKLGASYAGAPVWTLLHRLRMADPLALLAAVAPGQKPVIESAPCFSTES